VNVANVLKIGWLKLDKWHLAKHGVVNMGSLGWFVCGFQFDPSLHVAMVWPKKRGLGGTRKGADNCWNKLCLFPENCMWFEIFCT